MNAKLILSAAGPLVHAGIWLKLPPTQRRGGYIAEVERRVQLMPEFKGQEDNRFVFSGVVRRLSSVFTQWLLVVSVSPDGVCRFSVGPHARAGIRCIEWSAEDEFVTTSPELEAFALRLQNRLKAPRRAINRLDRPWLFRRTRRADPAGEITNLSNHALTFNHQ